MTTPKQVISSCTHADDFTADAAPTLFDVICQIAAELPSRPIRPPLTTEDLLRQVVHTGDPRAQRLARAELQRPRTRR